MAPPRQGVVAHLVREMIADGTLKPGGAVPSAAALARQTGCHVVTCRAALRALVADGTLTRGVSASARLRVAQPCMTLRDNTERPITVTEGTNTLAGRDPARIIEIAQHILVSPPAPRCPALWDGHAGQRIADVLLTGGSAETRLRPTGRA